MDLSPACQGAVAETLRICGVAQRTPPWSLTSFTSANCWARRRTKCGVANTSAWQPRAMRGCAGHAMPGSTIPTNSRPGAPTQRETKPSRPWHAPTSRPPRRRRGLGRLVDGRATSLLSPPSISGVLGGIRHPRRPTLLYPMVPPGAAQPLGTHQESGRNAQEPPPRTVKPFSTPHHQRHYRSPQLLHPSHQVCRARLPLF